MILRAFKKASANGPAANVATPAAFGDSSVDRERLDWLLFQNGGVILYHKQQVLAEHAAWLVRESYQLKELDAHAWKDGRAFHEDVKRAFTFPSHYTHNLASLVDALAELEIPAGGAVAVQIRRYDRFVKVDPHLAWSVLDALETTSRRLLLTGPAAADARAVGRSAPQVRARRRDAGELESARVAGIGSRHRRAAAALSRRPSASTPAPRK